MVVEKNTDRLGVVENTNWTPKARRHGERANWIEKTPAVETNEGELVVAALPPQSWPRIFPGI